MVVQKVYIQPLPESMRTDQIATPPNRWLAIDRTSPPFVIMRYEVSRLREEQKRYMKWASMIIDWNIAWTPLLWFKGTKLLLADRSLIDRAAGQWVTTVEWCSWLSRLSNIMLYTDGPQFESGFDHFFFSCMHHFIASYGHTLTADMTQSLTPVRS